VKAAARPSRSFVDELLDVLSNVLFPVVVFLVWAVMTAIGTIVAVIEPAVIFICDIAVAF